MPWKRPAGAIISPVTVRRLAIALISALALPALAQEYAVAPGKQRAAASKLEWEVRDAGHPVLGDIRFAYLKSAIETPVGNNKVYSRAYVSCQRQVRRFAIELTNATAPDDPKGLKPATEPRLFCKRPTIPGDERLVTEPMLATWVINELGDAMSRGFRAFPLRECIAIAVEQEVELPKGWAQRTAKVKFEITPYNRELDGVFATCGEQSAYAPPPAPPAPIASSKAPVAQAKATPAAPSPPPAQAKAPPPSPPPAQAQAKAPPPAPAPAPVASTAPPDSPAISSAPWQPARVIATGKTNVRGGPRLDSAVVIELHPGTPVLVQKTANEWWRARPTSGAAFDGFIRQDRLDFRR